VGKPIMYRVRGRCRPKDGQVHTDTGSKIIIVLLCMNPGHRYSFGGRQRAAS
jgi:SM-20-related protein